MAILKLSREGTEVLQLKNILYTSDLLSAFDMVERVYKTRQLHNNI